MALQDASCGSCNIGEGEPGELQKITFWGGMRIWMCRHHVNTHTAMLMALCVTTLHQEPPTGSDGQNERWRDKWTRLTTKLDCRETTKRSNEQINGSVS